MWHRNSILFSSGVVLSDKLGLDLGGNLMMRLILFAAAIGISSGSSAGAQQIAPPIEPGEIYAETANGCGVIFNQSDLQPGTTVAKAREYYAKIAWYGRCVDGLVDGAGQLADPGSPLALQRTSYILGRSLAGPWKMFRDEEKRGTTYCSGDRCVTVFDEPNPFGPRWTYDLEGVYAPDRNNSIMASREDRCMDEEVKKRTKKFGCSSSNNYRAYTIWVTINGVSKTVVCPDPRTSAGCDKLWMAEGKPIFDSIQAFVAPIQAAISDQRERHLALMTPGWRAQVEAMKNEILANGTAGQLRDLVAATVVGGDGVEAARLHQLLAQRFPASPAVSQSHLHLTALYCRQTAPALVLTGADAAETIRIFQSEPCRRTGIADPLLFTSKIVFVAAGWQVERDAQLAASWAKYDADRRKERDAYWGSMLGVVTGVLANSVAQPTTSLTYPGSAASAPGYGSPSAPSAYPGQSSPGSGAESVAHNPANDAHSCIVAIDKSGFAANGVRSVMGAVFRNKCAYPVDLVWCVSPGTDCNPGYSNLGTVAANSDRSISYDSSRPGRINWAACRLGFTRNQGELSRRLQHACK